MMFTRDRIVRSVLRRRRPVGRTAELLVPALQTAVVAAKRRQESDASAKCTLAPPEQNASDQVAQILQSQREGENVLDVRRARYGLVRQRLVKDFQFASGIADALRYDVKIAGVSVRLYAPRVRPACVVTPSVVGVTKALALLPASLLDLLEEVRINPGDMPPGDGDAPSSGRQTYASVSPCAAAHVLDLYPQPCDQGQAKLDAVIMHEGGHVYSFSHLGTTLTWRWLGWSNIVNRAPWVASQHATDNDAEDFAETALWYDLVKGTALEKPCREIFPERFAFLDWMRDSPGYDSSEDDVLC